MKLRLDHIAIAARDLPSAVAHVEALLGVPVPAGGRHPLMGTHNHLLRLGQVEYLEVIAPDPAASPPTRPRWFGLDDPAVLARLATPRLSTWVVATSDIDAALARIPEAAGPAIEVTRGELRWRISVPPNGALPFDGAFPTLIEWPPGAQPAARMTDHGCALRQLRIAHPQAERIASALAPVLEDPRISFTIAPEASLNALIRTPDGDRLIS